jgi:hypothetical protein
MDTINIINNFDQNILMENILILNQQKLLDLVFRVFDEDFKDKTIDELTIDYLKTYFDQLKFINWDLMIRLLNLKSTFTTNFANMKINSIEYIITLCANTNIFYKKTPHTKILEFLLRLPKGLIDWDSNDNLNKTTLFNILSSKFFCSNNNIVNLLVNSDLVDLDFWFSNIKTNSPIGHLFLNANEETLLEIIKTNKFDINKKFLINNINQNIISISIAKSYVKILQYIFENNLELNYEVVSKKHLIYLACRVTNLDTVKLLVSNGFDFNDNYFLQKNSLLTIKSEKIMMYLISNTNLILDNEIFYHAIQNNWVEVIKHYLVSESVEWVTLNYTWVLSRLIINKNFNLVKIILPKSMITFYSNLYNGLELYYQDPYGFNIYEDDNTDNQVKLDNTNNQVKLDNSDNQVKLDNSDNQVKLDNTDNNSHSKTD